MAEFGINATQLSEPRGMGANVVAPVQEQAISNAPVLGAITSIADVFAKGLDLQKKEEAEARKQSVLREYSRKIADVTSAFESGQFDASMTTARTHAITKQFLSGFSEYAGDITAISKSMKGETALSDAEEAVKSQREARRRNIADAEKDGFMFLEGAPKETVDATLKAHKTGVRARQEFSDMVQRNTETRAQDAVEQARRDREAKDLSFRLVNEIAGANLEDFQQFASELSRRVSSGATDFKSAGLLLGARMSNIDAALSAAARTNPELAAPYSRIFKDLATLGQQMLDPKQDTENIKAEYNTLLTKTKLLALRGSKEVLAAVANSELFKDNPAMQIGAMDLSREAFSLMSSMSVDQTSKAVPQVVAGQPEVEKEVLGMLKGSLKMLAKGNHPRQAVAEIQGANTVNQVMKQLGNMMNAGTVPPEELLPVVDFLASSEFGMFSSNKNVDRPTALQAKRVLQALLEPKIVKDVTARLEAPVANSPSSGKKPVQLKELISVDFSNGGVSFSLKPSAKDAVDFGGATQTGRVLSQLKGAEVLINKLVKASAHLEQRTDYAKVWEDNKHVFFPGYFQAPDAPKTTGPINTEEQLKKAAQLSPAEQAASDIFEQSPGNIAELEAEIARATSPQIKAILQEELRRLKGR